MVAAEAGAALLLPPAVLSVLQTLASATEVFIVDARLLLQLLLLLLGDGAAVEGVAAVEGAALQGAHAELPVLQTLPQRGEVSRAAHPARLGQQALAGAAVRGGQAVLALLTTPARGGQALAEEDKENHRRET